jgi:hypothetical protein
MTDSFHIGHINTRLQIPVKTNLFAAIIIIILFLPTARLRAESLKEYIYLDGKAVAVETINCIYSISTNSASSVAGGGTGSVSVTGSPGCEWTAASNNAPWLTVTGGANGKGNGTVN